LSKFWFPFFSSAQKCVGLEKKVCYNDHVQAALAPLVFFRTHRQRAAAARTPAFFKTGAVKPVTDWPLIRFIV
jgi:hypothetical protein